MNRTGYPTRHIAATRINNIVLVHGAFADGSSWTDVITRLQRQGYHVTAVQNPLTSLAADVTAVQRVISRQLGDVLLVGHSWAGAVVAEAGNSPRVKGLVFLSALVPDSHESVVELLAKRHAPMEGMKPDADGLVWLDDPDAYRTVMAADVPMERVHLLAATQQPMSTSAFADKLSQAAWHEKPTWYLITENDNALSPVVQSWIADNIGARKTFLKSSHMSLFSHPDEVVSLIDRAANEAIP